MQDIERALRVIHPATLSGALIYAGLFIALGIASSSGHGAGWT